MAEEKNVGYADMTVPDPSECKVIDTHLCFSEGRFYVNEIHVNDFPTRIDVTEQVAKAIAQYLTPAKRNEKEKEI